MFFLMKLSIPGTNLKRTCIPENQNEQVLSSEKVYNQLGPTHFAILGVSRVISKHFILNILILELRVYFYLKKVEKLKRYKLYNILYMYIEY